jgi:sulfate adenylyltransferase subunit 2
MLRLAEKAFWPCKLPFPVMHVDTGHNFAEVIEYRDRRRRRDGMSAGRRVRAGRHRRRPGSRADRPRASRNPLQTTTLLRHHRGEPLRRGVRRRPARRGEGPGQGARVLVPRRVRRQWDPKRQRPELWHLYNGRHHPGEHIRVFPLSNWTELDIWQYIAEEHRAAVDLLRPRARRVPRDGMWLAVNPWITGCSTARRSSPPTSCATAPSATPPAPVRSSRARRPWRRSSPRSQRRRITERGATRADDRASEAAMEDRKREGYF